MFISYLDEYERDRSKYNVSSLRTGFISGAVCPEPLMHRIDKEFGIKQFTTGYGSTECSPIIYMCDANDTLYKKSTTVGRIGPMAESKIINPETLETVPWGEPGEVCVRGYNIMLGYWDDEKKT
jgi:fatty-acyl-CoA synthase